MLKEKWEKQEKVVSDRFLLGIGSSADEIVSVANNDKVEMIVIGSTQLKDGKMITLKRGNKSIKIAPSPVLTVRQQDTDPNHSKAYLVVSLFGY